MCILRQHIKKYHPLVQTILIQINNVVMVGYINGDEEMPTDANNFELVFVRLPRKSLDS